MLEPRLVFPAPRAEAGDWNLPEGFEEVRLAAPGGPQLVGWLLDLPNAERYVVYFHGNGGNVAMNATMMRQLGSAMNATILCVDYRGYGQSAGNPTEPGVKADGLAAFDYLLSRFKIQPDQIVVYGRSLGGAIGTFVAAQREPGALILDSTFDSMAEVAAERYPFLPVRWAMANQFRSIENANRIECPVFQFHRSNDESVGIERARRLHSALTTPNKSILVAERGTHNSPLESETVQSMAAFLDRVMSAD